MSDTEHHAPGITADWLNAWMAALGITVLVPGVRLRWTDAPVPNAVFSHRADRGLASLIAASLPSLEELDELVIADLPQNLIPSQYRAAAIKARDRADRSLGALTSDLGPPNRGGTLETGPFNVGAPRGETLFDRLRSCRAALPLGEGLSIVVESTLVGRGRRVLLNGLGFDYRRIAASVPGEADKLADPLIECLCFYGLLLHPMGGDGRRVHQRGWSRQDGRPAFAWPVWRDALDCWAVDALLDIVYGRFAQTPNEGRITRGSWSRLGVYAMFATVPFLGTGTNDTTRGYASERLA